MARCPCHDDNSPSLHVEDKNGKVVFYCHAGCSQEDLIAEFKALGLWASTGANDNGDRPHRPRQEDFDAHDSFCTAMHILRNCQNSEPTNT